MTAGIGIALALLILSVHPSSAQQHGGPVRAAEQLAARAEEARLSNKTDEAIGLYRKALTARPRWAEGWWHLGTLLYDRDAYADAALAFRKAASLNPKVGTAWVMLGLCEFKLGRKDAALAHIQQGRRVGASSDPQFRQVMLYHEGLLLLDKWEFERAQEVLVQLSTDGVESEDLMTALGLSVLRVRPSELPDGESIHRQLVQRAGQAEHLAAQKKFDAASDAYERLAADFPNQENVYYALGRYFAATRQPEKAVTAYQRELENAPDHVPARLGIAAIKAETDPAAALPYAEEAVTLNPRIPLGHYVLGSLLLETNQIDRAIAELETALKSVRDDPGVYYALGRAYARAGRAREAERARATFKRLTEERQLAARRETQQQKENVR
jgi:tetratricopeptide (TPR) repeat protein